MVLVQRIIWTMKVPTPRLRLMVLNECVRTESVNLMCGTRRCMRVHLSTGRRCSSFNLYRIFLHHFQPRHESKWCLKYTTFIVKILQDKFICELLSQGYLPTCTEEPFCSLLVSSFLIESALKLFNPRKVNMDQSVEVSVAFAARCPKVFPLSGW